MSHYANEYLIYLRKSRSDIEAETRGEGETLVRHQNILIELARRQNLNVTEIYREMVSGETIAARPVMQKLLSEVEQGRWAGVIVVDVDRLARGDTIDQGFVAQTFKFSDTLIVTPMKTYDPKNEFDEEYFEFGLFMSRREYKVINRRLQRGRIASVREGKYVSGMAPYGYRREKLDKGYTLKSIPEQSEVVRMIFQLYTKGKEQCDGTYRRLGVSLIANYLNKLKIPSRSGGQWTNPTIRDMLINPVYIGKIRWNWRPMTKKMLEGRVVIQRPRAKKDEYILVDGLHDGIVDESVFFAAQEFISKNPPRPVGERRIVKNPLGGLIVCAKCGRKMVRRPYPGDYPDTLMCPRSGCGNVSSHLNLVEERILNALAEWIDDYKLEWKLGSIPEKSSFITVKRKLLTEIKQEIVKLEKQKSNLHDLLEQGVYDTQTFLDRTQELSNRLKDAEEKRIDIETSLKFEQMRKDSRREILPKVEQLLSVYHRLSTPKQKNDILKDILEKIEYFKENSAKWNGVSVDDFELRLYPNLPHSKPID